MQRQSLSNSDLQVSPICLGTMTFGNPVSQNDAVRLVHWAIDQGINFIDTADMYEGYDRFLGSPGGVGETILGHAIHDRRKQVHITTKVGNSVGTGEYEGTGLSRSHILHQIDASLRRLQTDYVDIYELHRPDPNTPLEESVSVMVQLIEAGKVRHWGFSNYSGDQIHDLVRICDQHSWPRPVVSQSPYSWIKRDEESNSLPACRELQISVTPYQPLQGGLLTGKYQKGQPLPKDSRAAESPWLEPPQETLLDDLARFEAEARETQLSPAQYAIHWLLNQEGIDSVVVGLKRVDQLDELLKACS
jgi:aryl-alcohol dehydrogenase-like predicted oxidoreductase